MMSKDYKTPDKFKEKSVLVIGSGNTAYDIAVELGKVAKTVYLSRRRGSIVISRIDKKGMPQDCTVTRARMIVYFVIFKLVGLAIFNRIISIFNFQSNPLLPDLKPTKDFWTKNVVINDEIAYRIVSNQVVIKDPVKVFDQNSVTFENDENKTYIIDTVILAAGYQQTTNKVFDSEVLNDYQLINETYRYVFPLNLDRPKPSLAIVGNIVGNTAAAPLIELQSRWIAQVLSNKIRLPSKIKMKQSTEKIKMYKKMFNKNDEHLHKEDFFPYADELANEFGAKPQQLKLFLTDFKMWWTINFEQAISVQYRLSGPHRCPTAKQMILDSKRRIQIPLNMTDDKNSHTRIMWWIIIIVTATAMIYQYLSRDLSARF
ncbi:flavin-dependent monooxygenas [Chamberlinius hualienensis]